MRWYRRSDGAQAFYLSDDQIECIMEDELRRAGLFPSVTVPAVDIEQFIEVHLDAKLDPYAELDPSVLGVTDLEPGVRPKVSINRDLTGLAEDYGDVGDVGRWRATLAHEGSHVVLHRMLSEFAADQGVLFAPEPGRAEATRLLRCLKRDIKAPRDWKEVQANKGMAALLMPRTVFREVTKEAMDSFGVELRKVDRTHSRAYATACSVAERFKTSREATIIRLETLGFLGQVGQPSLGSLG